MSKSDEQIVAWRPVPMVKFPWWEAAWPRMCAAAPKYSRIVLSKVQVLQKEGT